MNTATKPYLLLTILLCGCSAGSSLLQTSRNALTAPLSLMPSGRSNVSKILCLWEAGEGTGVDGKPTRGFAGQIMFFGIGTPSPIKVNGTVRIYEYDNFDIEEEDPTPIHMFTFKPDAWNAHRSEGTLGQTYNVFIPYSPRTKGRRNCGLRVELTTKEGRKVVSPFTEIQLAERISTSTGSALQRKVVKNERKSPGTTKMPPEIKEAHEIDTLTIQLPQ